MADLKLRSAAARQLKRYWVDNGDGTFSEKVDIGGASITLSGEVEVKNDAGNPVPVGGEVALDAATLAALEAISAASTIADGADVAEGAVADAAVVTDTTGTLSGKLRGLVKWAFERMPASLGQKTKAASLPVTLASDEDALDVETTRYTAPVSGEFAPGVSAAQFPTLTAKLVRLKARAGNTGNVYVGDANDVTVANGVTDVTTGFELTPGDDSGWLPVDNLNRFWGIGNNATDAVTYMVLA